MLVASVKMISFRVLLCPPVVQGNANKNILNYRKKPSSNGAAKQSSISPADKSRKLPESKRITGSNRAQKKSHSPEFLLSQTNTAGILGGMSVLSTLIFLEKLVWWSSKDGGECIPFVVCSDAALIRELPSHGSFRYQYLENETMQFSAHLVVENMKRKREFLERSGARCIVMPCQFSHAWHSEISEGSQLPFLHVGDCLARELKEAELKPLEAGTNVRIGVLTTDVDLGAGIYQEKLQKEGFEVVFPDRDTMEHVVIPVIEALNRKDSEGAKNLLRIAIQILLIRAVNFVILASDEMQGLLPHGDPLLKKCIDPLDPLARSTIKWAKSTAKENEN